MQKSACIAEISTKVTDGLLLCSPCIVGVVVLGVHTAACQVGPVVLSLNISRPGRKNVKLAPFKCHLIVHQNSRILRAKCIRRHSKS